MGAVQQVMLGIGSSVPGFSPNDVANLDWWMDGDNASINGVPEFDWPDISANAKHYGQNIVAQQPSITGAIYNGHRGVQFAAGKDLVPDTSALDFTLANTMIVVCTKSSAAEYIFRGSGGQGGPAFISAFASKDFEYLFTTTAAHERATFAASTDSNLHILTVAKTDDTGNYVGYFDGVEVFNNAIHTSDDWNPQTLTRIGALTAGAGVYDGVIAYMLHYAQNLAGTSDLDDVHDFLLDRFLI